MEGVIRGELVVEEEVIFDCINKFLRSISFSSEG
jgi:hypothetical protein